MRKALYPRRQWLVAGGWWSVVNGEKSDVGSQKSDPTPITGTSSHARPTWLDYAHWQLDASVFAAYGWPASLTDDEILARLPALNLERAATQGTAEAGSGSDVDEYAP